MGTRVNGEVGSIHFQDRWGPQLQRLGFLPEGRLRRQEGSVMDLALGIDFVIDGRGGVNYGLALRVRDAAKGMAPTIRLWLDPHRGEGRDDWASRRCDTEMLKRRRAVIEHGTYPALTVDLVVRPGYELVTGCIFRTEAVYRHIVRLETGEDPAAWQYCTCVGPILHNRSGGRYLQLAVSERAMVQCGASDNLWAHLALDGAHGALRFVAPEDVQPSIWAPA